MSDGSSEYSPPEDDESEDSASKDNASEDDESEDSISDDGSPGGGPSKDGKTKDRPSEYGMSEYDPQTLKRKLKELEEKNRGLEKENKRLKEENEEKDEELEKKDEELEKKDEELEKKDEELEKQAQLKSGVFYAPFPELWITQPAGLAEDFNPESWCRNQTPAVSNENNVQLYEVTKTGAHLDATFVKDATKQSRTSHQDTAGKKRLWPVDVLGNPNAPSQIAHLIPAGPIHASVYYNVARWACGVARGASMKCAQKLIHGYSKTNEGNRVNGVGLKHFPFNKLRMSGQKEHFDENPNVIIIPILTKQKILGWNGEGYDAIFMIGGENLEYTASSIFFFGGRRRGRRRGN